MNRLRIATIGCGNFGAQHRKALATMSDTVDLVACVDRHDDRAASAAAEVGARSATHHREVLDSVDAITIATPHPSHAAIAQDAFAAGVHVFMEKPLAMSESEADAVISAARAADRVLMVGYPLRYHPLHQRMHDEIVSGRWGEPVHVTLNTEMNLRVPEGHWRSRPEGRGGGSLFSHGCHYIDLLLWHLGSPVRGIHLGTTLGSAGPVAGDTTGHAIIEFANGAIGHHFGTEVARRPGGQASYRAHLTDAVLNGDPRTGELTVSRADREPEVLLRTEANSKFLPGEFRHFLDCIRTGAEPETSGTRSAQSLRVIWRLYRAAEDGSGWADLRGLGLDG
ncbi:Gfo/Idh/MocA family protein [Propionibacteriaceae bacterium Y2011]